MTEVNGEGPAPAQIMLCGEAPGAEEERLGRPFVGPSGYELDRMLGEVGLSRSAIFVTNVCRLRPVNNDISAHIARTRKCPASDMRAFRNGWATERIHDGFAKLKREVELVRPNVIVAFGNLSTWALTGRWGITDWRGSELRADIFEGKNPKVLPTYHPAAVLRQWTWRAALLADLRRAALNASSIEYEPLKWVFKIKPSFDQAVNWLLESQKRLDAAPTRICFDLETRYGHIACAGFALSPDEAFCIPFIDYGEPYWSETEETHIIRLIQKVLLHKNALVLGQNLLFDCQYTYRSWHFVPRVAQDTMISFHTAFCELPKALAFQASLMCDRYIWWKGNVSYDPLKKDA